MLEIVEREIGGKRYQYSPLTLKPARNLFDKLVQCFGPALSDAIAGLQDAQITEDMELSSAVGHVTGSAAGLIRGLASGLSPQLHAEVADLVAKQTQIEIGDGWLQLSGVRETELTVFSELGVIAFALEVQFADFLEPMRTLALQAVALRAKAGSGSGSRPGSTGSPTASHRASATATP